LNRAVTPNQSRQHAIALAMACCRDSRTKINIMPKQKLFNAADTARFCGISIQIFHQYCKVGSIKPRRYRLVPWRNGIKRLCPYYDAAIVKAFIECVF